MHDFNPRLLIIRLRSSGSHRTERPRNFKLPLGKEMNETYPAYLQSMESYVRKRAHHIEVDSETRLGIRHGVCEVGSGPRDYRLVVATVGRVYMSLSQRLSVLLKLHIPSC